MKRSLYCGIDLHSSNAVYFVVDQAGDRLFKRRLANDLPLVLKALQPYRQQLKVVAVESTYNWYWLVDGLMEAAYPVCLANPAAMQQYRGIKQTDDFSDAAFLAELARLGILPKGYIYPKEDRPVRDMLRRRMLMVQHRTSMILSLQNMFLRQTSLDLSWKQIAKVSAKQREAYLDGNEFLLFVADQQIDLIERLNVKIKQFEKKILPHVKIKKGFESLLTLPGVGPILGATIMLETGTVERFAGVGNYTSYCRAVRSRRVSNGKQKGKNNAKNGNKYLAWAFVEAAHRALAVCPPARSFYDRKKRKGKLGCLATKALAAKWAKAAYFVMKRQEAFDLRRVFGCGYDATVDLTRGLAKTH